MKKTIVGVKYKNNAGEYGGRAYTYYCTVTVAVGDIVIAPTASGQREAMIIEVDIPASKVEKKILPLLKTIVSFAADDSEATNQQADGLEVSDGMEPAGTDHDTLLAFGGSESDQLIIIKQMPVIEQQLEEIKPKIEAMVEEALAMECTKDNIKKVKKMRTAIRSVFDSLDKRRIQIKTQYMASYDAMLQKFKDCVTEPCDLASAELKRRIDTLENEDKKKTEDMLKAYHLKYAEAAGHPDIPYERVGINVTLSASENQLKDKISLFIDRVAAERSIISGMDRADEIMAEFNKTYNLKASIDAVKERHRLIDDERRRREEADAAEAQRKEALARATEQARQIEMATDEPRMHSGFASPTSDTFNMQKPEAETNVKAELPPDTDASLFSGFGMTKREQPVPKGMVRAIITITDTPKRIQALEQTLSFGGYEYGITYSDNR